MKRPSRGFIITVLCVTVLYLSPMMATWVCGRIDYARVLRGHGPLFARGTWVIADGGTTGYQGFGYFLVRVHTMMENLSSDPADGGKYKSGANLRFELRWLYPSIVDLRSDRAHVETTKE
jgi:hypothetical protein